MGLLEAASGGGLPICFQHADCVVQANIVSESREDQNCLQVPLQSCAVGDKKRGEHGEFLKAQKLTLS